GPAAAPGPDAEDPPGLAPAPPGPADQAAGGGVVRAPPPLRPASAGHQRASDARAPQPGRPPPARRAGDHGGGLPAVRPPLPQGRGAGQLGPAAPAGAALPQPGQEPGQVTLAQPGEGADLPGRPAAAGDFQRGGAREPPPPQDAKEHLPARTRASLEA